VFKRDITYIDFNDETQTETLYFNLTMAEMAELNFEFDEGFESFVKQAALEKNNKRLFSMFKLIMAWSYGRRTPDGKGFVKKKEWLDELFSGRAYEELFLWLFTSEANASQFYIDVMPKDIEKRLAEINRNRETTPSDESSTTKKLRDMSREELEEAFAKRLGTAAQ
jgi:hypothetical protein